MNRSKKRINLCSAEILEQRIAPDTFPGLYSSLAPKNPPTRSGLFAGLSLSVGSSVQPTDPWVIVDGHIMMVPPDK